MAWAKWDSLESFNEWHEELKARLGYPFKSIDASGQEVDPLVVDYTKPVIVASDDVRAWVDEEYATGLAESEAPAEEPREKLA